MRCAPATLLAMLLAALAGCAPMTIRGALAPHAVSLELQRYAGRLRTARVVIAGQSLTLLLDTGGGLTLLTPDAARRIGCVPGRSDYGYRMSGERVAFRRCDAFPVSIAGLPPRPLELHEFDLNSLLPPGLPPLDGLLALDALAAQTFTLDLANNLLTLESAASLRRRSAAGTAVPLRVATGVDGASVAVFLNAGMPGGQSLWLELDSGNLAPLQLAAAPVPPPAAAGAIAAATGALQLTFGSLRTEPLEYAQRELIHDGALNAEFLERYAVTVDIRQRRAWLTPSTRRTPP